MCAAPTALQGLQLPPASASLSRRLTAFLTREFFFLWLSYLLMQVQFGGDRPGRGSDSETQHCRQLSGWTHTLPLSRLAWGSGVDL